MPIRFAPGSTDWLKLKKNLVQCNMKMRMVILFVCFMCVSVMCNENHADRRKGRLLTFNTVDNDIEISLEFSVPFLTIPIKKTMENAFGQSPLSGLPSINVNPASLALGGAVLIGSTILIPLLLKSFTKQYPEQRYSRLLNNMQFDAENVLNFANQMMESRSIQRCTLRVACWTGQNTHNTELLRAWKQVTSNKLLSSMVNSTAIAEAMVLGKKGIDCLNYSPCPVQKDHWTMLVKNFAKPDL